MIFSLTIIPGDVWDEKVSYIARWIDDEIFNFHNPIDIHREYGKRERVNTILCIDEGCSIDVNYFPILGNKDLFAGEPIVFVINAFRFGAVDLDHDVSQNKQIIDVRVTGKDRPPKKTVPDPSTIGMKLY